MYSRKTQLSRRIQALLLVLSLTLSLVPAFGGSGGTARADYSDGAMEQLINWGVVKGYPDGQTHPERELTRAEYVAMVNRAYGYRKTGETPFNDVPETAWYADDVSIAYNAKYFNGVSPHMAGPEQTLTREQAVVMLARNMRMDPIPGEVTEFTDGRDCADWSSGLIRAAAREGIISGGPDGSYQPRANITRGQMAVMLVRALGTLINQPGVHTLSDHYGSVTVSSPNTTLKDTTIYGDLYITGGLDLGDITLDNVRVLGKIIVAGGGESQSGESIILRNVEAESLIVDSMADQYVSLGAEGNTLIENTVLRSNAYVQDRTRPGEGLLNITLESPDPDARFTLSGNLENVVNKTPGSLLKIALGTVNTLTIDEYARNSVLNLDIDSTVKTLNLDTAAEVTGVGDIGHLFVNAPGCVVEMLPDIITIRPGLIANIAGEPMDPASARESSSDPRLLAGYPRMKNVAPTSATAIFSGNKAGKVYWAISLAIDGSIGEDELIDPTDDNTRILLHGTTDLESSNAEFTAALTGLDPDTNYYISAILVDARGRHSPVKVASFKTPDNTVPAFADGYPVVKQNDFKLVTKVVNGVNKEVPIFHVQVAAMPNKSCLMYYALYPEGSFAPTGQQFRTGALDHPLQSGVTDVTKNLISYLDFRKLDELTTYDLYLWLTDADGAHSSQVVKLTFKTTDGTAPEFQDDTPVVTDIALTSVRINVNVNEDATVFWLVVPSGDAYLKSFDDPKEWAKNAQGQIERGTGSLRRGSVNVRKDVDVPITISGLQPATNYDVYYVAKDLYGNYSIVDPENKHTFMLQTNTLDNEPPTAKQEFTRYPEGSPDTPYANTDVYIVFSEDVMQYTPNQGRVQSEYVKFDTLYQAVLDAETPAAKAEAKEALAKALRATIKLYNANSSGTDPVQERNAENEATIGDKWVIDYRNAKVARHPETSTMMVWFPSVEDEDGNPPALHLSSGATYYFLLDDISDTSSSRNRMGRTMLPRFTTISAQVKLQTINVTAIKDANGNEIPIDMAFSLLPVSTNVESNVDWDMIFWSDTSVAFEIYELGGDNNATALNNYRVIDATTGDPANVNLVSDAGDGSFRGRSYFRHFYDLTFNPSVTGKDGGNVLSRAGVNYDDERGIMHDNVPKYYGIHFTSVKHVAESSNGNTGRDSWDATINFHVSVLTGKSVDLGNLAGTPLGEDSLTEYVEDFGVAEIHSPNPFLMRKQFSNKASPGFYTGYPQFTPTDTTVTLRVMLDRPGTLFYAIAPVKIEDVVQSSGGVDTVVDHTYNPAIGTTVATGEQLTSLNEPLASPLTINTTMATATLKADTIVEGVPRSGQPGVRLSSPEPSSVYTPNFGSDAVKTGSLTLGTSYQDIKVTGLTNNTLYFVYLVTKGTGQVYSKNILLYQFTTLDVIRPNVRLVRNGNTKVDVSVDMNAVADYGLFLMDSLPEILSQAFYNAVDPEYYTLSGGVATPTSKAPAGLTASVLNQPVYEVMLSGSTGGSLYDTYATTTHKEAVRALITGRSPDPGLIDGSIDVSLNEAPPVPSQTVDCEATYNIEPVLNYLFVAEARSAIADPGVSANSYGFAAIQPIYIRDTTPPQIVSINASGLKVDYTSDAAKKPGNTPGYAMDGYITLLFDKDLYLYQSETRRDAFTAETILSNFQQSEPGNTSTIKTFKGESTGTSSYIRRVTLQMTNSLENDYFLANSNLASQYSHPDSSRQLKISVRYDYTINKVIVTVTPSDPWYPASSAEFTPSNLITPPATGITLSKNVINLSADALAANHSASVTAFVQPDGVFGKKVIWSVSPSNQDKISISSTRTDPGEAITVTALENATTGTVTLIAKVEDDPSLQTTCTVNVEAIKPSLTTSPRRNLSITAGDTADITATLSNYYGGKEYFFTWTMNPALVVTIRDRNDDESHIVIQALAAGTTVLTVTIDSTDPSINGMTATINVIVNPKATSATYYLMNRKERYEEFTA